MIYSYKCPKGHTFDVKKPTKESKRAEYCPVCGLKANRVYSTSPIVVKGRGTYTVSYPKGSNEFWR